MHILIWTIEEQQYAIDLTAVDYVLLAVETTRLPSAPDYLLGTINVHGQIIPVINTRKLLGQPPKDLEIKDYFILAHVHQGKAAIWVDAVKHVRSCHEEEFIPVQEVLSNLEGVKHVLKDEGQIILIYDLEKLIPASTLAEI